MSGPRRGQNQTGVSISLTKDLLEEIDARARLLGITRSQYLIQLARRDLAERPEFIVREISPPPPKSP